MAIIKFYTSPSVTQFNPYTSKPARKYLTYFKILLKDKKH